MKKKIVLGAMLVIGVLAMSSCNVHKGCPAYSQVDVEQVDCENA